MNSFLMYKIFMFFTLYVFHIVDRGGSQAYTLPKTIINGSRNIKSTYDYIIIGGGAAGCALARTLADSNYSVLLVERGGTRINESELTRDINGMGRVVDDKKVSELIITKQGVRTHTGNVLGGGTAINMGMIMEETPEYFQILREFSGANFNTTILRESYEWISNRISNKGNQDLPIVGPMEDAFKEIGFVTEENPNSDFSLNRINGTWRVFNLFNVSDNGFRMSSDILLSDYQSAKNNTVIEKSPVDILVNHLVTKIEFERIETQQNNKGISLIRNINTGKWSQSYETNFQDLSLRKNQTLNAKCIILENNLLKKSHSEFDEYPFLNITTGSFINQNYIEKALKPSKELFRNMFAKKICVNDNGMIILSSGAIHTPILLYKSGIGPIEFLQNMNIMPLLDIPNLGTNIVDRLLFAIPFFFKSSVSTTSFVNPIMSSFSKMSGDCGYNCNTINIESLGGGRTVEGTLYATRLIFPPRLRNNVVTDFVMEIFKKCAENYPLSGGLPICLILQHPLECLRRSAAIFYFTSEPKSRGGLRVKKDGKFELDGNYLYEKEDRENVISGLRSVIKMLRSGKFENIAEEGGYLSCPMTVLNGIIGVLSSARTDRLFLNKPLSQDFMVELENVYNTILAYKNSLFPEECNTMNDPRECLERKNIIFEKIATFPPILPDLSDENEILSLAYNIGTSIWHWSGSVPLGELVENETFLLSGTKNLGIVDASLLKILPRINPVFTIMSLGRYAGVSILQSRKKSQEGIEKIYG
ncbi:glucose-methanol-choline oxidoreductase-like protein [Cryptosporidium canis]|uniref:Glucose-methanol-choline oxidoreductase-like protein n=1 Tax=Cryptosporidium canis TaxID=195482 RepID=A0ABQ8PBD5_9CRYT|nr:glucose-methanol-choline oxidoreductase-like protein [Cryptosporidium canis]